MKEAEFKAWLLARGTRPAAANTRAYAVRTVEKRLRALGIAHDDIDRAIDAGELERIAAAVRALRDDAAKGGEKFRVLMPDSQKPGNRLSNSASWVKQYARFHDEAEGRVAAEAEESWPELQEMRARFLQRMPDFRDFEQRDGRYFEVERAYKDVAIAEVRGLAAQGTPEEAGRAIFEALVPPPQGLPLAWRTNGELRRAPEALATRFHRIVGDLARTVDAIGDALPLAMRALASLRGEGLAGMRQGEVLGIAFSVYGTLHPDQAAWFKISKTREAVEALGGHDPFAPTEPFEEIVADYVRFMHRIRAVMADEWGWRPRDLFDVQGFLWVTSDEEHDVVENDEPALTLFDAGGSAYEPRVQFNQSTGVNTFRIKPAGASNETADAIEETDIVEVARALLIGGRPVRIALRNGTTANYLRFPGKLVRYRLRSDMAKTLGLPELGPDEASPPTTTSSQAKPSIMTPTNLILYGPPGTGKTYATAREAVALCDGAPPDAAAVRTRYAELVAAGQVRFVTFHQSYAYEDFVEGLRPMTGEAGGDASNGGFRLEPVPGVFREIASVAEQALKSAKAGGSFDMAGRQVFKMSLGRAGSEDHIFDAAIEGGYVVLGWGGDVDWTPYDSYDAIFERWNQDHPGTNGNDGNIAQVSRFRADMREGDLVVVSYGNSRYRAIGEIVGPYEFAPTDVREYNHRRAVRWLFTPAEPLPVTFYDRPFTMRSCYLLREQYLNRDALALVLPGAGGGASGPKQFVLICDEINRANISKVFGELITLIEPDKRIGAEHELKVTLPYSKQAFGVSANLHIIGTMNTADRSIALLDTALRRRFEFRELMPDASRLEPVDDVDLPRLLTKLNDRIEYLFDREHQVGHAFFMGCATSGDIDEVMRRKVIPLLAEYFHEDWGKIAAVLGDARGERFLRREVLSPPEGLDGEYGGERYRWSVREPFADDAYAGLR